MHIMTLTYRLAGNIYSNEYILSSTSTETDLVAAQAVFQAQRAIQTQDVEYISMVVTDTESGGVVPVVIDAADVNGNLAGGTAPAITFLVFTFYPSSSVGKTTHRIRGFLANDIVDLGVFNIDSSGRGDFDGSDTTSPAFAEYAAYVGAVAANCHNRNGSTLRASQRVSIGAKRATNRL